MSDQNWILTKDKLPAFDTPVLVYCGIYGRYIGWYQRIGDTYWGNWYDGKSLGVLPPLYWQPLPEPPK